MNVHPLIFVPIFRPKVWGGRKLEELGKTLPPATLIGESWECADLDDGQSVVAVGPAKGRTLSQLVVDWGPALIGRTPLVNGRFPLLIKFLDAREPLSVQVHPHRPPPGSKRPPLPFKHEAWYVIAAAPNAVIYRGFRHGVRRGQFAQSVGAGDVVPLLRHILARPDQCLYCPGGTVHALGGGILVAEVQTPSDVTYRLFDRGRQRPVGDAGLHIEEALDAIDWDSPPPPEPSRSHIAGVFTTVSRLIRCENFQIEKVRFIEGVEQDIPYAELVIWIVLEGRGAVHYDSGQSLPFVRGNVVVLPAELRGARVRIETACTWLEVTVPVASDLSIYPRPSTKELRSDDEPRDQPIQLGIATAEKTQRD